MKFPLHTFLKLLPHLSEVQIFSKAPRFLILSILVLPSKRETKLHTSRRCIKGLEGNLHALSASAQLEINGLHFGRFVTQEEPTLLTR